MDKLTREQKVLSAQVVMWYYPLKNLEGTTAMKNTDKLGRLIKTGDVCAFASRRGSHTMQDVVVIREVNADGIKGDKLVKEWTKEVGWEVKLIKTHRLQVPEHLVITGMTEQEAIELLRIRSEH